MPTSSLLRIDLNFSSVLRVFGPRSAASQDVSSLIAKVAAQNADELGEKFDMAGIGFGKAAVPAAGAPARTAEAASVSASAKPPGGAGDPPAPPSGGPASGGGGGGGDSGSGGDSTSALQARFAALRQPKP